MPRDFGYRDGVAVDIENTGMVRGGGEVTVGDLSLVANRVETKVLVRVADGLERVGYEFERLNL